MLQHVNQHLYTPKTGQSWEPTRDVEVAMSGIFTNFSGSVAGASFEVLSWSSGVKIHGSTSYIFRWVNLNEGQTYWILSVWNWFQTLIMAGMSWGEVYTKWHPMPSLHDESFFQLASLKWYHQWWRNTQGSRHCSAMVCKPLVRQAF